ncbi:hypothetical protein FGE12_22630 [Aggregicoccus sp. 17bor-14]|uniref:hypothetical protein n=1 Tax=Myxococcaceae TaxID=31 RepID=UPI00129D183A|nr:MULTISPECIES: hypothetical protein [Myxococcaceae]MBF5045218.1 hypothetical protein [Simulacricoccus sp. 17bor-14]MRI90959.1 hypothetical protein [Aggregicoccus sp. 17bor-14]
MTSSSPTPRARQLGLLLDAALLLALALVCLRALGSLEAARDLTLWDEADYLRRGLALPQRGLPAPEWGPLHSLLYLALAQLTPDPVALHDLAYRLLVTLPTLGLFLCARRARIPRALALLGALLFLASGAPHVAPRPSLLALAVVLGGLWVALAPGRSLEGACAALGLSLLLACYARPELFLSFVLLSLLLLARLLVRARRGEARGPLVRLGLSYGALALALLAVLGNPAADRTGRRLYAFCQHYALGEVQRSHLDLEPWGQCDAVMQRSFGEVHSVREAARANPHAFWVHLRDNLQAYPGASLELMLRGASHASLLVPAPPSPARRAHALLLAGMALGLLALGVQALRRPGVLERMSGGHGVVPLALVLAAVLLPSALSSVLLHPREHYLVLQGVLLPLCVLGLAAAAAGMGREEPRGAGALAGALAVALIPAAPLLGPLVPSSQPVQRQVVAALRETAEGLSPQAGPLGVLEAQGGYDVYLGRGAVRVSPTQRLPGESFEAFLERRHVRLAVLEPQLVHAPQLAQDPDFRAFLAEPEDFGFHTRALPGTGRVLAVREAAGGGGAAERAALKRAQ